MTARPLVASFICLTSLERKDILVAIVTDVHYRMSLAIIRDLGEAGVNVICCEPERYRNRTDTPPLGALSRYAARHIWLPDEGYPDALHALCCEVRERYGARPALLPVGAATLAAVAARRGRFDDVCGLLIPTEEQLSLFNSKERLAVLAASLEIPTPESFSRTAGETVEEFAGRLPYPCVVKPVCGEKLGLSAAQRYAFVNTESEAVSAFFRFSKLAGEDPVVQRRLTGGGLGCSVLAVEGKVVHSICHRRVREYPVSGGPSSCCRCEEHPDLLAYAEALVSHTGYSGLAMFEFKEDRDGKPYLLEVNPRIWGTFPLTRVSKSGMSLLWCTRAWQTGNPDEVTAVAPVSQPKRCKMIFAASDIMAAIGYLRCGKISLALEAALDFINPFVRDGLFEWGDSAPAFAYFRALLSKEKR